MRTTLRIGSRGGAVIEIQRNLNARGADLNEDGIFGLATERAVEQFQSQAGLIDDGIVGQRTGAALFTDRHFFAAVDVSVRTGYDYFRVRNDVASPLRRLDADLMAIGSGLSSSGGVRSLRADVTATRSATSLHYVGLAFDLHVGAAMSNPESDPYVVVRDNARGGYWRVLARVSARPGTNGVPLETPLTTLSGAMGYVARDHSEVQVNGLFVDLTAALEQLGWKPIRARRSFFDRNRYGGAEWWHFQNEAAIPENATFGSLLSRVYSPAEYQGTPPAQFFDYVWREDFF